MILVLGATGFLGKAVCAQLKEAGRPFTATSLSMGCDLRDKYQTQDLFERVRPTYVLNCAAYVGGIQFGYHHSAELFYNNLSITLNILDACHKTGVKRIVNPISNCAYPGEATLFRENEFWDGPLHDSVLIYGLARKMSWAGGLAYSRQYGLDQINLVLSNMFGPRDHFEAERSHAMGALIAKISEAYHNSVPKVDVWGTGAPVREWLYVEDGATAMIKAMEIPPYAYPINIGIGKGISIREMAHMISKTIGYNGELAFDYSKPDGAPHKTMDGSLGKVMLGWSPQTDFVEAVKNTILWYEDHRPRTELWE